MNYSRILPVAAAFFALIAAGCSSTDKPAVTSTRGAKNDRKVFVVSVESAAFFKRGPQAGRNPDKSLPKQTVVKMIRPSFGYSKVELAETGEQGYVATDEIQPAGSALVASVSAPKPDPLTTPEPQSSVEQFNLNSSDPRLIPPPEDLPPTELPDPTPEQ